ncbi:MAG TPA: DUF1015 domain-containing protein [Verrucomicrobia bacterium]|nr:DUF1015 domain-containing protein [Verrucomicrobiales bacterium]HIL55795.1 DUF1015 domain-containing protein [Verrucomicrobiota bacterium]
MLIKAFSGLIPEPDKVESVAAVPYDVVNRDEAAILAEGNPESLLNVSRAEITLPSTADPYSDEVYLRAKNNFEDLQAKNVLKRESEPCMYLYRQIMGDHSQTGLVAVSHIDDYRDGAILKHEKTRPVKENDRTTLAMTLRAHLGPVFLTYRSNLGIDHSVKQVTEQSNPHFKFTAEDGVEHIIWRVPGGRNFQELFSALPSAYIADGHHRSASAARVGAELREQNESHTGEEDYNWFLTVFFPDDQLSVLPYNRTVTDLNGYSDYEFIERIKSLVSLNEADDGEPAGVGETRMFLSGRWYSLIWDQIGNDPVNSLDVSILQDRILDPVLGVKDPRTDNRIDFIGGIRGTQELVRRVEGGSAAVAFSMYPVDVSQLMSIADSGEIMPPKSTWFEPKLRSGLFIHTF